MDTSNIFIALCVICGMWNIVTSIIIYSALQKRGYPVNFLLLRVWAPKYAFQYKTMTQSETGRAGALFYQWIISINLALVFVIAAIISRL
jgi:hypothetical protein